VVRRYRVDNEIRGHGDMLSRMGIRILLHPWWARTVTFALWVVFLFAMVPFFRYQIGIGPNPLSVSTTLITITAVACIGVAGLLTALAEKQRNLYRDALNGLATAEEKSQAITALWRGPTPDNPRVREAAGRLAWLRLKPFRKNRRTYRVWYPLLAVLWVALFAVSFITGSRQMLIQGIVAALFVWQSVWALLSWRRLEARLSLLDPSLLNAEAADSA
jgi:hypothetical protein